MTRLSSEVKQLIIREVHKGKSLNKIAELTKLGKTTVYYYMRKITGKKYVPLELKLTDTEVIGEVIGFFAGDGRYAVSNKGWDRRILFYFNKDEIPVINYYRDSIAKIIGKLPTLMEQKSVKIVQVHIRVFCDFIISYLSFQKRKVKTIQLKDKMLLKNKKFIRGFIRGLTDSDGYVRKGRKEIYYGSISKNLFSDFLKGLDFFGLKYKVYVQKGRGYSDFYKVRLSGEEVDKFIDLISPAKRL